MTRTIADIRAEYSKADALFQEVQGFRNKAGIPAAFELRYAGHHFLRALDDQGALVSQDDLQSAINHCRRACYEATEAGIVFGIAIVKKFQDDYPTISIGGIVPEYVQRLKLCNEALRLIDGGREDGFDRNGDHSARIEVFREIRDFCDDLDVAREEANKLVAASRTLTRRFVIQITLAAVSLAVILSLGIWASTGYKTPWSTDQLRASKQTS